MNFFPPALRPMLLRAPWRPLPNVSAGEQPYAGNPIFMKYVCHVTGGISIAVSDMGSSSWVGALTTEQLLRNVSASAPDVEFAPTELLRLLSESCRRGDVTLRLPHGEGAAVFRQTCEVTINIAVDVISQHSLVVAVRLELLHVSAVQVATVTPDGPQVEFLKDLAVQPLMVWSGALQTLIQHLLDQRRITPEELQTTIHAMGSAPPRRPGDAAWEEALRQQCFPVVGLGRAPEPVIGPPAVAADHTSVSPLARKESIYVESPEEVARRRKREEERRLPTVTQPDDGQKLKKLRKVLS